MKVEFKKEDLLGFIDVGFPVEKIPQDEWQTYENEDGKHYGVATVKETGEILFVPANLAHLEVVYIPPAGIFRNKQNSPEFEALINGDKNG